MDTGVNQDITRRDALAGGMLFGAAALLAGCARTRWQPLSEDVLNEPIPELPDRPTPVIADATAPAGVIPRRSWTSARVIDSRANPMNGVRRITIHHSGISSSHLRSQADAARMMENIRKAHVAQDWADIGYHYVIDPQGRIWEGRPIRYQGAHVKDNNEHNLGIMLMGNFEGERPTNGALASLDRFVVEQMRRHRIALRKSAGAGVYTHQELMPTACPGRHLQSYMLASRAGGGRIARA